MRMTKMFALVETSVVVLASVWTCAWAQTLPGPKADPSTGWYVVMSAFDDRVKAPIDPRSAFG